MKKYLTILFILILTTFINGQNDFFFYYDDNVDVTPPDTIPSSFNFTDLTNVNFSAEYTSDSIIVADFDSASISISAGSYRQGASGSWETAQSMAYSGDTIWVKNTSSADYSTAVVCTLTIGGVSDIYSITTRAAIYDSVVVTPLASNHDGFYKAAYTDITGTKLIVGGSSGACNFAVRFPGITIPSTAVHDSSRLYMYGGGEYSGTTVTKRIYGEDVDSIGVFIGDDAGADFNTRDNTLTTAYVADTNVPTWSTNTLYTYVTTSITAELVATRTYTNEAMALFVIDQGSGATANRRCWSYDNGSLYPTLKIYFHY